VLQKRFQLKNQTLILKVAQEKAKWEHRVSEQSKAIKLYYNFLDSLNKLESKFKGKEIKRPLHWGGYCVAPTSIEFWQGRPSRLHDRLVYEIDGKIWNKKRLAP